VPSEPDDPRTGVAAANFGGWVFAILIVLMLLRLLGN
jgi:hypothetical protein